MTSQKMATMEDHWLWFHVVSAAYLSIYLSPFGSLSIFSGVADVGATSRIVLHSGIISHPHQELELALAMRTFVRLLCHLL